jgi:hypothetical protein
MRNQLPKTARFIYDVGGMSACVSHGSLCCIPSPSIHPAKMMSLAVRSWSASRKRIQPGPFSPGSDDPVCRMLRTCRHCACSRGSDRPNIVRRRGSTSWLCEEDVVLL